MKLDKIVWMIGGAILLTLISSLIFTSGVMTPINLMPTHLVLLAWTIGYFSIFIFPVLYLIEFLLLSEHSIFGSLVLISTIAIACLSVIYFYYSWEYGIQYQGVTHTRIVAIENLIGIGALTAIAALGVIKQSEKLKRIANLLLFSLIVWCIFPYLGELP